MTRLSSSRIEAARTRSSFRGQAAVASTGGSGFRIENLRWDAATNMTRRTPESAANSGITELRLIRPGYDRDNPPTFTYEFLAALRLP